MTANKIKLIQTLGEMLIPLLGYFFWDWNFYFIALFYFLDVIGSTCILPLKINKIAGYKELKQQIVVHFSFFVAILFLLFMLGVSLCQNIVADFNFGKQTIDFIMHKDLGIPQGFFLLPLLGYASYMQYKMEYLLPKRYEVYTVSFLLKKHLYSLIFTFILVLFAYGISSFSKVPELFAVLVLISLTTIYSYRYKRG